MDLNPHDFDLHSGRVGGATRLAEAGASTIQIQKAILWKSDAFMPYVRAAGEGASTVSRMMERRRDA